MTSTNIEKLNELFSFEDESSTLKFINGSDNIPVIEINNLSATSKISLQGAHVLSWKPNGQTDVIWLSEDATFSIGKSVRGGIPICWPWFGAHESNDSFPAHGFARTVLWEVAETKKLSPSETRVTFKLLTHKLSENLQKMWPQDTVVEYQLIISNTLSLKLITTNNSAQDIIVGQALHTYFNVENINNTIVHGLEGITYLDKPDNFSSKVQNGSIKFNNETDRIYLDTMDDVIIDNGKRKIVITKQGSRSTVVWNPWEEVAEKMGDLGINGYQKMLCVESANAASDTITIKAGESHTMSVMYEVK